MSFDVKIDVFEGPFDLLLQLITTQELSINEVPVAQITSSFLENMYAEPNLDLDTATEFLLIAATLLLIKARSLLPSPENELDVEDDPEAAKEDLVERLLEYKTFSNASVWLEELYARNGWYIPRLRELEEEYAHLYPDPFEGVEVSGLSQALMDLLIEMAPAQVDTSYIAPIKVSVAEKIQWVRENLEDVGSTTFSELILECRTKLEVIATFLAILELYKSGEVTLTQRKRFGKIEVKIAEGEKDSVA